MKLYGSLSELVNLIWRKDTRAITLRPNQAVTYSATTDVQLAPTTTATQVLVEKDATQTLTAKTLTAPIISTISNTGTLTLPTSTDTLVGRATTDTLTNKTLTSPTLNSALVDSTDANRYMDYQENTTSPGTPAASTLRLYSKSDNKFYSKDPNGVETAIGAGSGTGTINYITNFDFETGLTTGWNTYNDGAVAIPVDGTGGTVTGLTTTANSTTPLRGTYDLNLVKDAASRLGEGWSFDFSIKAPDKSRKLTIQFDYNTTAANYVFDDIVVYIYDVTNAVLITPSSPTLPKASGTFQTSFDTSTSTSYRLIFHIATTRATAYSLFFDTFIVGPGTVVQSAAISGWVSFTPTGTWATNTTYTGSYRRIGSDMELDVKIALTGAPTGNCTINMPTGFTIDTTALSSTATGNTGTPLGRAVISDSAAQHEAAILYSTTSAVALWSEGTAGATLAIGAQVNATVPATFANTDFITARFHVPVAEWAGNGVVNLGAGPDVEYASTSGTWNAASSTTVYGPSGAQMSGALTIARNKSITWQYPPQATDTIQVELSLDGVQWFPSATNAPFAADSTNNEDLSAGVAIYYTTINLTVVRFYRYQIVANDDFPVIDWTAAYHWRVKKSRAGAATGFGLATGTQSGLVALPTSQVTARTSTGYGSTATKILRWSTFVTTGTAISNSGDDAVNGTFFTINEAGVYSVAGAQVFDTAQFFAITLNDTNTTTSVASLFTDSQVLMYTGSVGTAGYPTHISATFRCAAGDTIRFHSEGGAVTGNTNSARIVITQIAKL